MRDLGVKPEDILQFWLEEVGPSGWYRVDESLDDAIRDRFQEAWARASGGEGRNWCSNAPDCLALIILLDQFPRNMFRGDARSFQTDPMALSCAKAAIANKFDDAFEFPAKQFFYLPFMHSEARFDQDRGVRLFCLHPDGGGNLRHAVAHRWVIREFGRFPYRNEALGRSTTAEEQAFLDAGGYAHAMKQV